MISIEVVRCRIPTLLHRIGKTQSWLAGATGFSKSRISDYVNLRNGEVMSMRTAVIIAHILGCKIDDLYEWRIVGIGRE